MSLACGVGAKRRAPGCVEGRLGVRFCHQVLAEEGNAEADEWTQRQKDLHLEAASAARLTLE